MINNFFGPYKHELLYSCIARYYHTCGDTGYMKTSKDLFGIDVAQAHVMYPTKLDNFISNIPQELGITKASIIKENTILPIFLPFITLEMRKKVEKNISIGDSRRLIDQLGIRAGGVFKNKGYRNLKFCPECFREDEQNNRCRFIRRLHQVPGNFICEKHNTYLMEYEIPKTLSSYYYFDIDSIDIEVLENNYIDEKLIPYFISLLREIEYIFEGSLSDYSLNDIRNKYRKRLQEKGYLLDNRINQKKLEEEFIKFYPKDFLEKMESYPDREFKNNWFRTISTFNYSFIHPIRHLLFIRFLFGSVANFIKYEYEFKPFRDGPWPCLNPVAKHNKMLVVTNLEIRSRKSIKNPYGVFKCSCGFTYSRTGPDESEDDKYKLSKILEYGEYWESVLREKIMLKKSIDRISKEMKCDSRTVIKYAEKLGIINELDTKLRYRSSKKDGVLTIIEIEARKDKIKGYLENHPIATRADLRKVMKTEYDYIFNTEREWIESLVPLGYKKRNLLSERMHKDNELVDMVNKAIKDILAEDKPQRITRTNIARRIGYMRISNESELAKFPKTREVIINACETVNQFKKR